MSGIAICGGCRDGILHRAGLAHVPSGPLCRLCARSLEDGVTCPSALKVFACPTHHGDLESRFIHPKTRGYVLCVACQMQDLTAKSLGRGCRAHVPESR